MRLSHIERPEAINLYANVMSLRAKLVHARQQWIGEEDEAAAAAGEEASSPYVELSELTLDTNDW